MQVWQEEMESERERKGTSDKPRTLLSRTAFIRKKKEDEQSYPSRHRVFSSILCFCVNQSHFFPIQVQNCSWPVLTALPDAACKRQQCDLVQFKAMLLPERIFCIYTMKESKQMIFKTCRMKINAGKYIFQCFW